MAKEKKVTYIGKVTYSRVGGGCLDFDIEVLEELGGKPTVKSVVDIDHKHKGKKCKVGDYVNVSGVELDGEVHPDLFVVLGK